MRGLDTQNSRESNGKEHEQRHEHWAYTEVYRDWVVIQGPFHLNRVLGLWLSYAKTK